MAGANFTCRVIARASIGGSAVRLHVSNVFSDQPLAVDRVSIAVRSVGGSIFADTAVDATFGGAGSVMVPANSDAVSDAIPFSVSAGDDLAVSMYFAGPVSAFANHRVARTTDYCTDFSGAAGDHTRDVTTASFPVTNQNVPWLSAVDVRGGNAAGSIVAIGDSITDGVAASMNANASWPSLLAVRLRQAGLNWGVVNAGIGGNQLIAPGGAGPTAIDRFDRDVLNVAGARTVIIAEGTNDIQAGATSEQIISALSNLADRAHAAGLKVVGATIIPRNWGADPAKDSVRTVVNTFVRSSRIFDHVADFDAAVRSQSFPSIIDPAYDSGDHVHPNDNGDAALAAAINLTHLR